MARVRIRLLGSPTLERGGSLIRVRRRKALALLAYLAATGSRHSRDQLASLLYPRHDRARGRANLRICLNQLRDAVGREALWADRTGVELIRGPGLWVDLAQLEELSGGGPAEWERALSLVRGTFLESFYLTDSPPFEEWQRAQEERLLGMTASVYERATRHREALGDLAGACDTARAWLDHDRTNERALRCLLELLSARGDRDAALRHYELFRRHLAEATDDQPEEETRLLVQSITRARGAGADHRAAFPVLPPTVLVGRVADIETLCRTLGREDTRLVTVTGPPGVGKTRAALEVAHRIGRRYPDGAVFVDLSALQDAAQVASAIAAAVGLREVGSDRAPLAEALTDHLGSQRILLILDNFEHLMPAATLLARLIETCPTPKVLVTSRRPLLLRAEREVLLQPLPRPASMDYTDVKTNDAVRLFVDRATAARPEFRLTPQIAPTVAAICERLDGLPLAIELAASRVRQMHPAQILQHLESSLDLLTGGPADLPERQRTLRGEIGWSLALLDEQERTTLSDLSVFVAGWTAESAQAVCGTSLGHLDQIECLVHQSLVTIQAEASGTRYRMLYSIREYAGELLASSGRAAQTEERFVAHFLDLAEGAEPFLRGPDQKAWFARLGADYGNLCAALGLLLKRDPSGAARLAAAMGWYWFRTGRFTEARYWLEETHRTLRGAAPPWGAARLAFHRAWIEACTGRSHLANPLAAGLFLESYHLARAAGDARTQALSAACRALQGRELSDEWQDIEVDAQSAALLDESIALARGIADPWTLAFCLRYVYSSVPRRDLGRDELVDRLDEAIEIARGVGDPFLLCLCLKGRGDLEIPEASAVPWWRESLELARAADDLWSIFEVIKWLPHHPLEAGDLEGARAYYREGLRLAASCGAGGYLAWFVGGYDYIARREGRPLRAARLWAAAARLGDGYAKPVVPVVSEALGLSSEEASRQWSAGQAMTLEQIMDFAFSDADP